MRGRACGFGIGTSDTVGETGDANQPIAWVMADARQGYTVAAHCRADFDVPA
jgi:hypothetical protein